MSGFGGTEERGAKAESGGRETHLHRGFAHALEGVTASFGRGTFVDEVTEDGGGGEDGEIDVVEGLEERRYVRLGVGKGQEDGRPY